MTGRRNLSRSDGLFLTRHYHIVHEQKKAVDNVHIADSAVEIYRKQVDARISLLYPVFYPPLHYMIRYTAERLQQRIPYCFVEHPYPGVPRIPLQRIEPGKPFSVEGMHGNTVEIIPFRVMHGKMPILAFRIGNMAWVTDMTEMPEESNVFLENLDCLIMNALRLEPHWTHQSLPEAIERAKNISAKETYFIHASHHIGLHADVEKMLPEHMYQTYDGMVIEY